MWLEILLVITVLSGTLALFLLNADPAESENDGGIGPKSRPTPLSTRWSRLQLFKDEEDAARNVKTVTVSKDTIYAMMQRGVYVLNEGDVKVDDEGNAIDDGEDDRWARELMERMCAELDLQHPNVMSLIRLVNDYCDNLEKIMNEFEESLCRYNNSLAQLTEKRMAVEKEIKKQSAQCKQPDADEKVVATANDESSHRHWKPRPVSIRDTIVVASRADDDFLTIIEQFEKALEEHHK
ncbi:uncharacterized protein LOC100572413 isoform X1 [Acyrthosiphon pisum]|uniref:Uncharacterized protein n=1 Tax=Acyrthosiphon pisum TaxID=7029 RepID=A0A8R1W7I0_ACYPI|nr:uncharacterized protein LOC100572413 isoform X1 [Acyrthosiphon pisum]|eukprot:XP_003241227.1 PREDICTED: uncharacterized protein LOC100572413 isoform X1 [Acyrthosiphon pisum]